MTIEDFKKYTEGQQIECCDLFLGGSCNPTTWRFDTAIPALLEAGVSFFNPQIENWSKTFEEDIERRAKETAYGFIFVIDGQTRGVASLFEVGYLMGQGYPVFLVVEDIEDGLNIKDHIITGRELDDLNRGRHYVRVTAEAVGALYPNVEEAVKAAIVYFKN